MAPLTPGANQALPPASTVTLTVATQRGHVDLVALCVDGDGRAGDNDVALWTQPECAGGAVKIDVAADTVTVALAALPAQTARVLIVAQADGVADVSACGALSARLSAGGAPVAELSIPSPPAMPTVQVAELYRRGGDWKVRCLGDGYADGLAKLLTVHGITVDDEPEPEPVPAPAQAGGIRMTKGEEELPVDMRKKLSLRKQAVAGVMLSKGIADVRARVIVVLDASGSMAKLYPETMQNSVERVVAVAAQLDDDGRMEAWRFASKPGQLPTLELRQLPQWLAHCVVLDGLFGRLGGKKQTAAPASGLPELKKVGIQNEEQKVIAEVRAFVRENPTPDPTFVLFFSDGGVYRNKQIEHELIGGQREPIFWQFIGLGSKNGYGVLERFDTLPGREIDNVGFFAIDDIDRIDDSVLYERILSEFPQWLRVVRGAGII
jgi:stress response protein SCP2